MFKKLSLLLFIAVNVPLYAVDIGEVFNKIGPILEDINAIGSKIGPVINEVQKQAPKIQADVQEIANGVKAIENEKLTSNKIKNMGTILARFADLTMQLNTLITKLDDIIIPVSTLVKLFNNNAGQQIDQADTVIDEVRAELQKIPEIAKQISELTQTIAGVVALGEQFK